MSMYSKFDHGRKLLSQELDCGSQQPRNYEACFLKLRNELGLTTAQAEAEIQREKLRRERERSRN